jgi:hypothetical protein
MEKKTSDVFLASFITAAVMLIGYPIVLNRTSQAFTNLAGGLLLLVIWFVYMLANWASFERKNKIFSWGVLFVVCAVLLHFFYKLAVA